MPINSQILTFKSFKSYTYLIMCCQLNNGLSLSKGNQGQLTNTTGRPNMLIKHKNQKKKSCFRLRSKQENNFPFFCTRVDLRT